MSVKTKDEFKNLIEEIKSQDGYREPIGFGIARVDLGQLNTDKVLQATFPVVNWNENFGSSAIFTKALELSGVKVDFSVSEFVAEIDENFVKNAKDMFAPYIEEAKGDAHKNVQLIIWLEKLLASGNFKIVFIFEDTNPVSVESVYLKLYALSLGKAKLRTLNLDGAFGLLTNVAWVDGVLPIELDFLRANEIELKLSGKYPNIVSVDKFPRFLQHVIPADNTRILDSSKVRMGAQLAGGTTVMPGASYINFNAGTEGPVMVEGRISSSAIVKSGADVGGGASILGVLSGTNGNPISIGENTLLGANSVTGIPVGDACIIDAGVAILEGTKIKVSKVELDKINEVNGTNLDGEFFKGLELAGLNGVHFRVDSKNGSVVAFRSQREVKLNSELH